MKKGHLSQYFQGIAAKRLSEVEANPEKSNQHEFNGTKPLVAILGHPGPEKHYLPTTHIYFGTDEDDTAVASECMTWYQSRKPPRSEYRLYYKSNAVSEKMAAGDLSVLAMRPDGNLYQFVAQGGSTTENQLLWLFGLSEPGTKFEIVDIEDEEDCLIGFTVRTILEHLGIEVEETEDYFLPKMLKKFKGKYPTTAKFSEFARSTLPLSPEDGADSVLVAWMERDEKLFRTLEKHFVEERLKTGFTEVDEFTDFAKSVLNRRKSRVGYALENHLEHIFIRLGIAYTRGGITENKTRPDFLFPNIASYHNAAFPEELLTLLGVKSSCKDRWRQVLNEAKKIDDRHLFTLEPGISENQTNEMKDSRLQLVLPQGIHCTYRQSQQSWLMSLDDFIQLVKARQQ